MPQQQEFTQLLEPSLSAQNRFVLRLAGNEFDAAGIAQDTVVKAFVHFADFRAESKFKTWLISIAWNEVRGWRRDVSASGLRGDPPLASLRWHRRRRRSETAFYFHPRRQGSLFSRGASSVTRGESSRARELSAPSDLPSRLNG